MAVTTQLLTSRAAASERSYEFMGYAFRVLSDLEVVARLVHELLGPHVAPVGTEAATYRVVGNPDDPDRLSLHCDDLCVLKDSPASPSLVIDYIMGDATRKAVERQTEFLALHASAASWKGRGIIMPAPPDSGKTTTIAGLVRAGFDYLSDEAALINPATGQLHGFPRPLVMGARSVRAVSGLEAELPRRFHKVMRRGNYHVPCGYIRERSIGRPCPIEYVVTPFYSKGSTTRLESMSRPEAVILLVEQCFNFAQGPQARLSLMGHVLRNAECFRLSIGDLPSAVALIQSLFEIDR